MTVIMEGFHSSYDDDGGRTSSGANAWSLAYRCASPSVLIALRPFL